MSSNDPASDPRPESPAGGRLDSWKEIAAYLKRSVRSVQRWEAEEGMPVHRHLHDKRGTIYGFKSDLDAWWKGRGALLADESESAELAPSGAPDPVAVSVEESPLPKERDLSSVPRPAARAGLIGAGFGVALLLVGVAAWLSRDGDRARSARPLSPRSRDWVLLTSFENRTGEPLFDGTLEYALTRDLADSRYVNVVPRERIGDALRLMRKPLDTRVDAVLGREVCLRDGAIRMLLTGRIEKLGTKYFLTVQLQDATQEGSLANLTEEAAGQNQVAEALHRMSVQVRQNFNEKLPSLAGDDPQLAKVTTVSLKALQLFSRGESLIVQGNSAAAEEVFKEALAEDPQFASGYTYLAWAIDNQQRPESRVFAEKAVGLSASSTALERLFIRASYLQIAGQNEKAAAAYEALLSLYPNHYWGIGNLIFVYHQLGRAERAAALEVREADLRPKDFDSNLRAAAFLALSGELSRARPYVAKARSLVSPEVLEAVPGAVAWLELLPACENWLDGKIDASLEEVDRIATRLDTLSPSSRTLFADYVGSFYLTLGRLDAAEETFQKTSDRDTRLEQLSRVALARGELELLKRHLRSLSTRGRLFSEWRALLFARAGLPDDALRILAERKGLRRPDWVSTVEGEVALRRGKATEAIALLESGTLQSPAWTAFNKFFVGSESLAAALKVRSDLPRAVHVLENVSAKRSLAAFERGGALWIQDRFQLAGLYRELGRVAEAEKVEGDLRTLLSKADSDHPIVVELRRRQI